MVVAVLILIIVILTSNSFKNCIGGGRVPDTSSHESTNDSGTAGTSVPPESTSGDIGTDAETDEPPAGDTFVIYIDPGHGFDDKGAGTDPRYASYIGDYTESDITMMVSQEVVGILRQKGYDARLTHDGVTMPKAPTDDGNGIFSALTERPAYVNSVGVDLLVSIHCDSFTSESVCGTRIHYCGDYKYSGAAEELTGMLVRSIGESYQGQRSARAYFHNGSEAYNMTRYVDAPSALIEMGFVTNPDDGLCLIDPEWRSKMATGIANGIAAFVAGYEPAEE